MTEITAMATLTMNRTTNMIRRKKIQNLQQRKGIKKGKELQNIQREIHIVLNLTGKIIQTMDKEDEEVEDKEGPEHGHIKHAEEAGKDGNEDCPLSKDPTS